MNATDKQPEPRLPRRWFQYSLRTLLIVTLLISIGMSWFAVKLKQAKERKEAVEAIRGLGGLAFHDFVHREFGKSPAIPPPKPEWLCRMLGEDFFADVVFVDLEEGPTEKRITDAELVHLRPLTRIKFLNLTDASITDAGLAHLNGLTQIEKLFLGRTQVSDAGMKHLAGMTKLQCLDLSCTQVTDAGLEHLTALMKLQVIALRGTRVTREGIERLQKALPKCSILR